MKNVALVLAAALAIARVAGAHDLGISRMNLAERADGSVHGTFNFAARDVEGAFDRDGHVAVDVRTDGESCAPGPATTTPQGDGIQVDEDFACAKATRSIEAIAYFVTQIGGSHEDVAMIETPEGTHEELLRPTHRAIAVELHRATVTKSPHRLAFVFLAIAAAVALLAFAIRSILRAKA